MKTITKTITLIAFCLALAIPALAQSTNVNTNLPPVAGTLWDALTTGSNYYAVPFMTFSTRDETIGGGVAIGYRVSDWVSPVARFEYFNADWWNVSLSAELSPPRRLLGKVPVIPFIVAGGAIHLSTGENDNDGKFITVVGGGLALPLDWVGDSKFWKKTFIAADYERWIGMPEEQEEQIRFGFGIKF